MFRNYGVVVIKSDCPETEHGEMDSKSVGVKSRFPHFDINANVEKSVNYNSAAKKRPPSPLRSTENSQFSPLDCDIDLPLDLSVKRKDVKDASNLSTSFQEPNPYPRTYSDLLNDINYSDGSRKTEFLNKRVEISQPCSSSKLSYVLSSSVLKYYDFLGDQFVENCEYYDENKDPQISPSKIRSSTTFKRSREKVDRRKPGVSKPGDVLPGCDHTCRFQCSERISDDDRKQINVQFRSFNETHQRAFICHYCERMEGKRCWNKFFEYYLPIVKVGTILDGKVQVCQKFFVTTLGFKHNKNNRFLHKVLLSKSDNLEQPNEFNSPV